MDHQDIRTLKILEEIDTEHVPSQRDLAKTLNVSLGLVNSFIKRLAQKGYFKITTIPPNRVRYILTPKGAAEKTRLTYEYVQFSYQFYKESRKKLRNLFKSLENQGTRSVVFYGVGDFAEIAYISLEETDIKLAAIVDNLKVKRRFLNRMVKHPNELKLIEFDQVVITDIKNREFIFSELFALGIPSAKIVLFEEKSD